MSIEVIKTKDGSTSLFVPELNETYHSTHGAVTEAEYVFIKEGLEHYQSIHNKPKINILEIGFGTGLNALVSLMYVNKGDFHVNYHSLETSPLQAEVIQQLNYTDFIDFAESKAIFQKMHHCDWGKSVAISDVFTLQKIEQSIHDFKGIGEQYDIIYFDAFAPSKQPDMWSLEVFQHLYSLLANNGILTTYCAQGQFKRDLKFSGFQTESLLGPPGKKEMTRGTK